MDRSSAIAGEYGARVVATSSAVSIGAAQRIAQDNARTDWIFYVEPSDFLPENCGERLRSLVAEQAAEIERVEIPIVVSSPAENRRLSLVRRTNAHSDSASEKPPANRSAVIDVIVLSYAKTSREYALTRQCLQSLRASETAIHFNVVVVETNRPEALVELSADHRWFDDPCRVVFPQKKFNYNEFLQFGFGELAASFAESLLIINNDVVFEPGFATELLRGLETFESVSPWCPGYHEHFFVNGTQAHICSRTPYELCGWAIMFRKALLQRLAFNEFFPTDFAFWFQDNYYGWQLQRIGARHALIPAARVQHLFEQSHRLIEPHERESLTTGAQRIFAAKTAAELSHDILLTVAIPSLPSRANCLLPDLIEKLSRQADGRPVEILSLMDNKFSTVGAKRNAMTGFAQGRFIAFVDDDDDVSDDYVDTLLKAIRADSSVDVITFDAWVTMNGAQGQVCKYGCGFEDANGSDVYYRRPNHVCCFRTQVARQVPWQDISWGEDYAWAKEMQPHLHREARIERILYFYRYDAQLSEAPFSSADPEGDSKKSALGSQLTIAVSSSSSRLRKLLAPLVSKLARQANNRPVELLWLLDNQHASTATKRSCLARIARGQYLAFVDDDDDVDDDYVAAILAALDENPGVDCVVFDAWLMQHGENGERCQYSIEYKDENHADIHYRWPDHRCAIRADLAKAVTFDDIASQGDSGCSGLLIGKLQSQARIERVLYTDRCDPDISEPLLCTPRIADIPVSPSERQTRMQNAVQRVDNQQTDLQIHSTGGETALPIYGFMHVAMLNHWHEVVEEQLLKWRASGLRDRTQRLFVGLLGPRPHEFDFVDDKLEIVYRSPRIEEAEFPTLEFLQQFCNRNECRAFYIHTKGVFQVSPNTRDWRHLMEHFVILRHADCIRSLDSHDICGVNWNTGSVPHHFSGNFWWARSSYIRQLPLLDSFRHPTAGRGIDRQACERWIGMHPAPRARTLHQSEVNHFGAPYPRSKYAALNEVKSLPRLDARSAWQGLEDRFQDLLESIGPIRMIIEIGVEYGFSLFSLATAVPQATVIGIDPYQGLSGPNADRLRQLNPPGVVGADHAEACVRRHLPRFPNVILLRAMSTEIAEQFVGQADVVHIDAIHTYEDIRADFEAWEPKLRPGGCVLFHDTMSFPHSVGRFFNELPGRKAEIRSCNGLGAWYKPPASKLN